jgi:DNA invertase Pin-like site-specific DNA recombinase
MKKTQNNSALAPTTALIYTRVSSDEQAREGISLDAQLKQCRQYAARQGWTLGHEYQDVMSGTRDYRPQYQQLLTDVRRLRAEGRGVAVVVMKLDRFGRRVLERVRCREELKALGVCTHSVMEGGEVSDLVANILASVAEEEVRQLGERVSAVRHHLVEAGWFPGGRPAWGYRLRDATAEERRRGAPRSVLDLDPETAPYAREAFERVAQGMSIRRVALWLYGLPSAARGGRKLPYARLQAMLQQPVYIARLLNGGPDLLSRPRANWPALVDDDTWQEVQDFIASHRRRPHQASGRYLLAGFLRCPMCNNRMYGQPRRDRPHRYRCSANVRGANTPDPTCNYMAVMRRLDAVVMDRVDQLLAIATVAPELSTALRSSWQALQEPRTALDTASAQQRAHLEREAEQARKRLTNAAVLFADGEIDRTGYELLRDKARADLDASIAELERLGASVSPTPKLPSLDHVLSEAGSWAIAFREGDVVAKRAVLDVLIDHGVPRRVGWGKYDLDLTWTPLGAALWRLAEDQASAQAVA